MDKHTLIRNALNFARYTGNDSAEALKALYTPHSMPPLNLMQFQEIAIGLGVDPLTARDVILGHASWVGRLESALLRGDSKAVIGSLNVCPPELDVNKALLSQSIKDRSNTYIQIEAMPYEAVGAEVNTSVTALEIEEAMGW